MEKPLAPTAHLELVAYLVTLIGALCHHAHISAHGQRVLGVLQRGRPLRLPATSPRGHKQVLLSH